MLWVFEEWLKYKIIFYVKVNFVFIVFNLDYFGEKFLILFFRFELV